MYSKILPQPVTQLDDNEISPQIVDELCSVPWDITGILLINAKEIRKSAFLCEKDH